MVISLSVALVRHRLQCYSKLYTKFVLTVISYCYRPHLSWGKVIFSQASVILSTGCLFPGGVCSQGGRRYLVGTPLDGYCCGRYASYWNAFLFVYFLSCFYSKKVKQTLSDVRRQTDEVKKSIEVYIRRLELAQIRVNTRVPTRPGKPGKMRVHLENLEISWNSEKN